MINRIPCAMLRYMATMILASSFFLSGCENGGKSQELLSRERRFAETYSFSLNSEIELILFEPQPPVPPNQTIVLSVINRTTNCVKFPEKFGVKILTYKNRNWQEIPNLVNYISEDEITLMPEGDFFSDRLVVVHPDLSNVDNTKTLEIRVLVVGSQCNTNSKVGAYADIEVEK